MIKRSNTLDSFFDKFEIKLPKLSEVSEILLKSLKACIEFEKKSSEISLKDFVQIANDVIQPATAFNACEGCGNKMSKLCSDFQVFIWRNLKIEDASLVPELPKFSSSRFHSKFWQERIEIMSFSDLKQNSNICKNDSERMKASKNKVLEGSYLLDSEAFKSYREVKLSYFESFLQKFKKVEVLEETSKNAKENVTIDNIQFLKWLDEGKSLKEIVQLLSDIGVKVNQRQLSNLKKELQS